MSKHNVVSTLITEVELPNFWAQQLDPASIAVKINELEHSLLDLGFGAGKTTLIEGIFELPALWETYSFVVYVSSRWDVIDDRKPIKQGDHSKPVPWVKLLSRPRELCGELNTEWVLHETNGSIDYAKETICPGCPNFDGCFHPKKFSEKVGDAQLLFATDKRFQLMKILPLLLAKLALKDRGDKRPVLFIFDEIHFITEEFEKTVSKREIAYYRDFLKDELNQFNNSSLTHKNSAKDWLKRLNAMVSPENRTPGFIGGELPEDHLKDAAAIQKRLTETGKPDLCSVPKRLFSMSQTGLRDRWRDTYGDFWYMDRPYLPSHYLLLHGSFPIELLRYRLDDYSLTRLLPHFKIMHTGTRINNLNSGHGSLAYLSGNIKQVVDFFFMLTLKNVCLGITTVLVSKKSYKKKVVAMLNERFRKLNLPVKFVLSKYGKRLPETPDPMVIPIIHYRMVGVNNFEHYESLYCVNSYYANPEDLHRLAFDGMHDKGIAMEDSKIFYEGRNRRLKLNTKDKRLEELADSILDAKEMEVVANTAHRVRPNIHPREIVFFQMNDLQKWFPSPVRNFENIAHAYKVLKIPRYEWFDTMFDAGRVATLRNEVPPRSYREIEGITGIDRSTACRWIGSKLGKFPYPQAANQPPPGISCLKRYYLNIINNGK